VAVHVGADGGREDQVWHLLTSDPLAAVAACGVLKQRSSTTLRVLFFKFVVECKPGAGAQ